MVQGTEAGPQAQTNDSAPTVDQSNGDTQTEVGANAGESHQSAVNREDAEPGASSSSPDDEAGSSDTDTGNELPKTTDGPPVAEATNAQGTTAEDSTAVAPIEDRINGLEEQIKELKELLKSDTGTGKKKNKRPGRPPPRRDFGDPYRDPFDPPYSPIPAIPIEPIKTLTLGAEKLSWEQYHNYPKDPVAKSVNHIIEILTERPPIYQNRSWSSSYRQRKASRSERQLTTPKMERVRLMSDPLCSIMEEVMGKEAAPKWSESILRPYKSILVYWEDLHDKSEELEREVAVEKELAEEAASFTKPADESSTVPQQGTSDPTEGQPDKSTSSEASNANGDQATTDGPVTDQAAKAQAKPSESTVSTEPTDPSGPAVSSEPAVSGEDTTGGTSAEETKPTSTEPATEKKESELEVKSSHLKSFLEVMSVELKDELELRTQCRERKPTTLEFEHLWYLYAPGKWPESNPLVLDCTIFRRADSTSRRHCLRAEREESVSCTLCAQRSRNS